MIGKIIAITHLIVVILASLYGFVFPKNFINDYLYFVVLIFIQLHWFFLNGECVFSYIYKYIHYDNYTCGDTTDLDDFNELGSDEDKNKNNNKNNNEKSIDYKKLFVNVLDLLYIISVIIVNNRSKLSNIYITIFVLIILRYFYVYFNEAIGVKTKEKFVKILGDKYYKVLQIIYYDYHIVKIHNEINMFIELILILFLFYITYRNRKLLKI
jgi:hypothetical protein